MQKGNATQLLFGAKKSLKESRCGTVKFEIVDRPIENRSQQNSIYNRKKSELYIQEYKALLHSDRVRPLRFMLNHLKSGWYWYKPDS